MCEITLLSKCGLEVFQRMLIYYQQKLAFMIRCYKQLLFIRNLIYQGSTYLAILLEIFNCLSVWNLNEFLRLLIYCTYTFLG